MLAPRGAVTVGEAFGVTFEQACLLTDDSRGELDMLIHFDAVRVDRGEGWRWRDWTLPEWKAVFARRDAAMGPETWRTVCLSNHDISRLVSHFGDDAEPWRIPSAKLLATLLLTRKGTPFIRQGDEIGMTSAVFSDIARFDDIEVRNAWRGEVETGRVRAESFPWHMNRTSRDHARPPLQWDGGPNAGFTSGKPWFAPNPNASRLTAEAQAGGDPIHAHYARLIALRHATPALVHGDHTDLAPDRRGGRAGPAQPLPRAGHIRPAGQPRAGGGAHRQPGPRHRPAPPARLGGARSPDPAGGPVKPPTRKPADEGRSRARPLRRDPASGQKADMAQNIYDDPAFFAGYSQLPRQRRGLDGAPEWPALRALLPDVAGKRVADLGCGFGWAARWFREQGAASVVGFDLSRNMLARARADTEDDAIDYRLADLDTLDLPAAAFDLVHGALAFHYARDFGRLIRVIHRALAPGGSLVFTIEHPIFMAAAHPHWIPDEDGRLTWPVNGYSREGERRVDWFVEGVVKYHRTLATTLNTLIGAGLTLRRIEEFAPTPEQIEAMPDLAEEMERPMILLVAAERR